MGPAALAHLGQLLLDALAVQRRVGGHARQPLAVDLIAKGIVLEGQHGLGMRARIEREALAQLDRKAQLVLALHQSHAQALMAIEPGQEHGLAALRGELFQHRAHDLVGREALAHHLSQLEQPQSQRILAGGRVLHQEAVGGKRGQHAVYHRVVHAAVLGQLAHAPGRLAHGEVGQQRQRTVQCLECHRLFLGIGLHGTGKRGATQSFVPRLYPRRPKGRDQAPSTIAPGSLR
jgi:hypothetical protein